MLLNPDIYLDKDKLPTLVDLVEKFVKQDLSKFWIDVGEHNEGISINWKSVIVYEQDDTWPVSDELAELAKDIRNFVDEMPGINRVTINLLDKLSFMPIHVDDDTKSEYDFSGKHYNIVIPITDCGWSIVDYKVLKNKKGQVLMFSGQVPHGALNDTRETRVSIYLIVEKTRFKNDSA